jgi:hypothetical protein
MFASVDLTKSEFVVVSVVEDIEKVSVEWMNLLTLEEEYYVKLRKVIENSV